MRRWFSSRCLCSIRRLSSISIKTTSLVEIPLAVETGRLTNDLDEGPLGVAMRRPPRKRLSIVLLDGADPWFDRAGPAGPGCTLSPTACVREGVLGHEMLWNCGGVRALRSVLLCMGSCALGVCTGVLFPGVLDPPGVLRPAGADCRCVCQMVMETW